VVVACVAVLLVFLSIVSGLPRAKVSADIGRDIRWGELVKFPTETVVKVS
jgi:hypothetical protein